MVHYRRKKMNRYEKRAEQSRVKEQRLQGDGLFLFRNKSADFDLPKPAKNGIKKLSPNQEFEGDSYFLRLVREGELILVKTITPQQSAQQKHEQKELEMTKLLLDQPQMVTEQGAVENVLATKSFKKLNETDTEETKQDVLINEDPMEGLTIIIE